MAQAKRKQQTKAAAQAPTKKQPQTWQLQTAKAQFSEVFRRARTEGPQHVTKAGKGEVVILSKEDFEKMNKPKQQESLWDFFRNSPLRGSGIELERRKDYPRKEDSLIAATALEPRMVFVTRDTSELAVSGVQMLNPWMDS